MVLGFGYIVAAGPVGFFSTWTLDLIGFCALEHFTLSPALSSLPV